MINQLNAHPRDKLITFNERSHSYSTPECPYFKSVTTFISSLFSKFDADKAIAGMRQSPKWPDSEYFGMSADQIKKQWSKSGLESRIAGTAMHKQIENYYTNDELEMENGDVAIEQFLQWDETRQWEIFRTEWSSYDEQHKLAGTIDAVFRKPNGKFVLVDWKRCKEIRTNNKWQSAQDVRISHLPDCNFVKYSLQLNLYARILEGYGIEIDDSYIVNFHPKQSEWQQYKALDLKAEIQKLLPSTPRPASKPSYSLDPIKVEGVLILKTKA